MNAKYLCVVLVVICILMLSTKINGAGIYANPPIDTTETVISITNGPPTCHVYDEYDEVALSISGGVDVDCDRNGTVDFSSTHWTCTSGEIGQYGSTTSWLATTYGSGVVIRAYLNDSDTGDYNDDEKYAGYKEVTGFLVGCAVSTSPGNGYYETWEDELEFGSVPVETINPDVGNTLQSGTNQTWHSDPFPQEVATAEYQLMTYPVLASGQTKHNIVGFANVTGEDNREIQQGPFGLWLAAWDEDSDDNGRGSIGVSLGEIIAITWTEPDFDQPDACYAYGAAGFIIASEIGGIACDVEREDHSDNTNNFIVVSLAGDYGSGNFSGGPTLTKTIRAGGFGELGLKSDATPEHGGGATGRAQIDVNVYFDMPEWPYYNSNP